MATSIGFQVMPLLSWYSIPRKRKLRFYQSTHQTYVVGKFIFKLYPWNLEGQFNITSTCLHNIFTAVRYPSLQTSPSTLADHHSSEKELAPVPMRFRDKNTLTIKENNEPVIKVLKADRFEIHYLKLKLIL